MRRFRKISPVVRAISVMAAAGVITTGITFAALQSEGSALTGNKIESATAALQIRTDGSEYKTEQPGFDFPGVVPGGPAVPEPGHNVSLHNAGTAGLNVALSVSARPDIDNDTVDLSKIYVLLTPAAPKTGDSQRFSLESLLSGPQAITGSHLGEGVGETYTMQVSMDGEAFDGPGLTISNLDLVFTGTVAVN